MSIKITFLGAGSTIFARNLIIDMLAWQLGESIDLALYDIDEHRLKTSTQVAEKLVSLYATQHSSGSHSSGSQSMERQSMGTQSMGTQKKLPMKISAYRDITRALEGADFVFSMFQVGGYTPSTVIDFEIPQKYGLRQTIGDTLGIGGIMRALRTIPVLLEYCALMEKHCPQTLFLNYVNPMAMNQLAMSSLTSIKSYGLCHSIPHTAHQLEEDLGLARNSLEYKVAGINHLAFFLSLTYQGRDMYPDLRALLSDASFDPRRPLLGKDLADRVRYNVFKHFGYFVTESSEHFSEYVPWFIQNHNVRLLEQFDIPLNEYPRRCELQIEEWKAFEKKLLQDNDLSSDTFRFEKSVEYGVQIVKAVVDNVPTVVYANVPNEGIISNLSQNALVEAECVVDAKGIRPVHYGNIPPHLVALMTTNVLVQELTVEAIKTNKKEHVYHAAFLDPHTAASLSLDAIVSMVDELLLAHGDMIPYFT